MSIVDKIKELIPKVKEVIETYNKGKEASQYNPPQYRREAPYSGSPFPTFPGDGQSIRDSDADSTDIKELKAQLEELTKLLKEQNDDSSE